MGDLSELRPLIVGASFMALFVTLYSMSAVFSPTAIESLYNNTAAPSTYWSGTSFSLGTYNTTWDYQFNETGGSESWNVYTVYNVGYDAGDGVYKFGGHDVDLSYGIANYTDDPDLIGIALYHVYSGPWYWPARMGHYMSWTNQHGEVVASDPSPLYFNQLQEDYDADLLPYKLSCEHFYCYAGFSYNSTTDATALIALNHHRLYISLGIGFSQYGSTVDAWSLISQVLTFQPISENIIPYPVGYLIGGVLWAGASYLIFIFALRISSMFSGGGS